MWDQRLRDKQKTKPKKPGVGGRNENKCVLSMHLVGFLFILPRALRVAYYAWFTNEEADSERFKHFPRAQSKCMAELGIEPSRV